MVTAKDRRHSGRVTPDWSRGRKIKYKEAVQEALEPAPEYDDYENYRDGFRDKSRRMKEKSKTKKLAGNYNL